jgi:mono/diheme cytochrome c family protein
MANANAKARALVWLAVLVPIALASVPVLPERAPAATFAAPREQHPAPQGQRAQGALVTFERVGGGDASAKHTQRARLLSLAVERGETPTPFLEPGLFRATYAATVQLPARDRFQFRVEGRGTVKLAVDGEVVLEGLLRSGKALVTTAPVRLKKGDNELSLVFESGAMGDGQFRLFWSGPDFGFEPIFPERLASPADHAAAARGELLRAGLHLFAERRCARCHDPEERRVGESAFAELDDAGPDLRLAGARMHADWIAAWLRDPSRFRPDATMPRLPLTDAECADLAAFLGGLGTAARAPDFAAGAAARGVERFRELGCVACHVGPADGAPAGDRIDLAFVPQKWHPRALVDYLIDPRASYPHTRMPDLRVTEDDAVAIAAALLAAVPAATLPKANGDAARGKRLAQKHGCALCHALDVQLADRPFPRLRTLKAERGCLADAPAAGGAPDHALLPEQRTALRELLPFAEQAPFRRAPLDYAQRHLTAQRCTACHGLDGRPSGWARWAEQHNPQAPLPKPQDPLAQGVPALTWTGSKLQPSWIERFVLGDERSPRPWLTARMPAFHRRGAAIAQGLVRDHGYGAQDEPPSPPNAALAIHGERLLAQGTGFHCVQCHALGDRAATQVFEREGIELLTARSRLRHEYWSRWLLDPMRLDPDARMTKFADGKGKTLVTDVLGGDAAQQFEAIWQHLGTRLPSRR